MALLLFCTSAWAENQFKIITLQHRFGEDLLPVLLPMLEPGGKITASGTNLFVDVDAAQMPVIEQMIAQLDVQGRMFGIHVDRSGDLHRSSSGVDVSGRIGNDNVSVGTGNTRRDGITVRARSSETTTRRSGGEYINVMDGSPAFIVAGQRGSSTGFSVVPRQVGDEVELQITPHTAAWGRRNTGNFQTLTTTVRVKPGTWVNLGGMLQSSEEANRGILSGGEGESSSSSDLWVLVEPK
ncbi:MAG: hypothetical protein LBE24_00020 [Methylobacillus sp.]|nr:hypothetical protein [Methylobacillus sp.]